MRHVASGLAVVVVLAMTARGAASPGLRLHLDRARLDTVGASQIVVADARWVNTSGAPLDAFTNFSGVFDGLALVVLDPSGRELRRIHYTHHQSPYAEHRRVELPVGATRRELGFPIFEAPLAAGRYLVRLEGELVGNPRHRGLRTRAIPLQVP